MAKALKYWYEWRDLENTLFKEEIWVEGFSGTAEELKAGSDPLTKSYNKDVGEKYLGGIVPFVVNVSAKSSSTFKATEFTGENYGDAILKHKQGDTVLFNAIIVPFEGMDEDLDDGFYKVQLSAECGLNYLKSIVFEPTKTRKTLLNIINTCIGNIPYIDSFGYYVVDNTSTNDGTATGLNYYDTFIDDRQFTGMNCYDVIKDVIQEYGQLVFANGRWNIFNISNISKENSTFRVYNSSVALTSSGTYTRPTKDIRRIAGGNFGRMFSQQGLKVEKKASQKRSILTNSDFASDTGWTYNGLASILFEISDGKLKNKGNTYFTYEGSTPDSSYVQSPAATFYPFESVFNLATKQRLQLNIKASKGKYIKNLRLQIYAVQSGGTHTYYLTAENTWYRALLGEPTPFYYMSFEADKDTQIEIPQVPYLETGYSTNFTNIIPVFGEFLPYPYGQPTTNLPYTFYVRVYIPERVYDTFGFPTTLLDFSSDIDYLNLNVAEVGTEITDGFLKKFGLEEKKDRDLNFTIKLGVGYPSFPIGFDSLFRDNSTTTQITLFNGVAIEQHIADSYLSVLGTRQEFYTGTVEGDVEFSDLLLIDSQKYRIHNLQQNFRMRQHTIKAVSLGVGDDTLEELPLTNFDIVIDQESIQRTVTEELRKKYGDTFGMKFVDKNFEVGILADGQKSLKLREDVRVDKLYSQEAYLRTVSDGTIKDVATDTSGNFTLTKPAENGTYATREWANNNAWIIGGNTLSSEGKFGSLNAHDVVFVANNVSYLSMYQAGGLMIHKDTTFEGDILGEGNITIQKGNPRLRLRDVGAGGHTNGFDLHVNGDEFIIDDNTHSRNVLRNYLNSTTHITEFDADEYYFKDGATIYASLIGGNLNLPSLTASRLVGTDANDNIISLDTATYPSFTELAHLKGVTSAIQTQINGKFNTPTGLTTNYVTKWNGSALANSQIFDNGTNVGIGTTSPTQKLDVNGSILQKGFTNGLAFADANGTLVAATAANIVATLGSGSYIQNQDATNQAANSWISGTQTAYSHRAFVALNIGSARINTGTTNQSGYLEIFNSSTTRLGYIGWDNANLSYWAENGAVHYFSGNVGINTSVAPTQLTLANNVSDGFLNAYSKYQILLFKSADASSSYGIGIKPGTMVFNSGYEYSFDAYGSVTRMAINATGSVLINTNTTVDTSHLQVNGAINQRTITNNLVYANSLGTLVAATASNITGILGTGNYIQNQNNVAQAANSWIDGQGRFDNGVVTGGGNSIYPAGLTVIASTHATSRRATIDLGNYGQFVSDVFANGANDFGIYNALGNWSLFVKQSNNNVGINNINPGAMLDISSSTAANTSEYLTKWTFDSNYWWLGLQQQHELGSHVQWNLVQKNYSSESQLVSFKMGQIGIGTTNPTQKLDVNGTSRTTNLIITNGAAVGRVWQCNNADGSGAWVSPLASERYIGEWAANSGVAPSASPTSGDYWVVNTEGSYSGNFYFAGDHIYWNGSAWLPRRNYLTIPTASGAVLGGIKVGSGLSVDGSGILSVITLNQNTTGSAGSLTTARGISITGDGTWSVSFNGSTNVTSALTLATVNSNIGTFRSVTVNAKGLVTSATNPNIVLTSEVSGILPIANGGTGSATQNFVDISTNQTGIAGNKTFTGTITAGGFAAPTGGSLNIGSYFFINQNYTYNSISGSRIQVGNTSSGFDFRPLSLIASQYVFERGFVKLGGATSGAWFTQTAFATERLDVDGNIRYSGTLKPSNANPTVGQFLKADTTSSNVWATLVHGDISNLSSYTGFDARYYTEVESDAKYQLIGNYLTSVNLSTNVTGILPEANGGTGSSTKNFVDLTTNQTVAGNKTFSGITYFGNQGGYIDATSAASFQGTRIFTDNSLLITTLNDIRFTTRISGASTTRRERMILNSTGLRIRQYGVDENYLQATERLHVDGNILYTGTLKPNDVAPTTGQFLKATSSTANAWSTLVASDIPSLDASKITSGTFADARIESASIWNAKQSALNGTGFVKVSGTTVSYDNNTYLTANQTVNLIGVVSGSGATEIITTISNNALTIAMTNGLQTALDAKMPAILGNTAQVLTWDGGGYNFMDVTNKPIKLNPAEIGVGNEFGLLESRSEFKYENKLLSISDKTNISKKITLGMVGNNGTVTVSGGGDIELFGERLRLSRLTSSIAERLLVIDSNGYVTAKQVSVGGGVSQGITEVLSTNNMATNSQLFFNATQSQSPSLIQFRINGTNTGRIFSDELLNGSRIGIHAENNTSLSLVTNNGDIVIGSGNNDRKVIIGNQNVESKLILNGYSYNFHILGHQGNWGGGNSLPQNGDLIVMEFFDNSFKVRNIKKTLGYDSNKTYLTLD